MSLQVYLNVSSCLQVYLNVSVSPGVFKCLCVSPGGREGPALPGHVHLPPVQPGPVQPQLQEDQSHAELPGGEAAQARGEEGGGAGGRHRRRKTGKRLRRSDGRGRHEEVDGRRIVSARQVHQEQDGAVSGAEETEVRVGLFGKDETPPPPEIHTSGFSR